MKQWMMLAVLLLAATGCVEQGTLTQDITDIKSQIWRIQKDQAEQLKALQELDQKVAQPEDPAGQADMQATLDEINGNITILFERVRDLNDKMTFLLSKMAGMQPATGGNPAEGATGEAGSTPVTRPTGSPDALFSTAYTDYVKGNYEVAAIGFRDFAKNYPESDKVDNALYWLGLCYYEQEKYRDAINQFEKVISDYPDSDVLPAAMLRKGLSLFELNSPAVGVLELQDLIKKFPLSQEARIARKKLDELQIKYQ